MRPRKRLGVTFVAGLMGLGLVLPASAAPDPGTLAGWRLLFAEDFTAPLPPSGSWVRDSYDDPFDTVMDDNGRWWVDDYGQAFTNQLNSFATYRKEFQFGTNGWLTASLSARDFNNDGVIESPPAITTEALAGQGTVAKINVPESTGGAIFRPTNKLPSQYRVEYHLKTLDFGGKRNGTIFYGGRENGYSTTGCKTQHPWAEGPNTPGWNGDANSPYCNWQSVRNGPFGYNGFHFMSIVDFANPAPRNNHFWHYRRKVLMDSFPQHPDRVGTGTGGRICNAATNQYYNFRDSSFNTINMWVSGIANFNPGRGGLTGNQQLFMTNCSNGVAEPTLSSAAEMQPELMPGQDYIFAIERSATAYTLEVTGNFARSGQRTIRFTRPFVAENRPIWHYNVAPEEYDGRFNATLTQTGVQRTEQWANQWPRGSAYPDYFVIGDVYTNVYEGSARVDDIKLFVPA